MDKIQQRLTRHSSKQRPNQNPNHRRNLSKNTHEIIQTKNRTKTKHSKDKT